jgi:hypothetical protein
MDRNAIDIDIDEIDPEDDGIIEVYAELSHKQFGQIVNGEATVEIPHGSSLKHKMGSRSLVITCNGFVVAKELEDGLNNSGISWQENFSEVDYEKIERRNSRHSI